jgi:hypothetical protein
MRNLHRSSCRKIGKQRRPGTGESLQTQEKVSIHRNKKPRGEQGGYTGFDLALTIENWESNPRKFTAMAESYIHMISETSSTVG